jgi:hypothetical protein
LDDAIGKDPISTYRKKYATTPILRFIVYDPTTVNRRFPFYLNSTPQSLVKSCRWPSCRVIPFDNAILNGDAIHV